MFRLSINAVQELLKAFQCAVVTLLKFTVIQAKWVREYYDFIVLHEIIVQKLLVLTAMILN